MVDSYRPLWQGSELPAHSDIVALLLVDFGEEEKALAIYKRLTRRAVESGDAEYLCVAPIPASESRLRRRSPCR